MALLSQPDIMFAVGHLSQFTSAFGHPHWAVVKHLLHYLQGTTNPQGLGGPAGQVELKVLGVGNDNKQTSHHNQCHSTEETLWQPSTPCSTQLHCQLCTSP
jgi:hypothetical protein